MFDNPVVLLGSVLIAAVVLLVLITKVLPSRGKALDKNWYETQWQGIEGQYNDGSAGQQLAVINADKLLDKAMREKGFRGQTMGERLKNHPASFANIDDIWAAHKLRNRIAHENSSHFSANDIKRALMTFKKALQHLGAL